LNPTADDLTKIFTFSNDFPPPNNGNLQVHDPNIIEENDTLYLFKGGIHIPYWKASSMSGPWTQVGTVLSKASVINKKNNNRPWAPTVTKYEGTFYCFYAISQSGSRDSAIGYASTSDLEKQWTDHGALINTGSGERSQIAPYKNTNAIDPAFQVDVKSGQPYLIYGSYWDDVYGLPLHVDEDGKLSIKNENKPHATHLTNMPGNWRPQEGSYMSYREPYYYLWFSQGICCQMVTGGFPLKGEEYVTFLVYLLMAALTTFRYRIRVGRSKSITGPFVDKAGKKLLEGYGEKMYGSNNGNVYAPGGVGVLPGNSEREDILYHHFCKFPTPDERQLLTVR
jgi:arabinan endo-1,5-alpha-L-arabinosidase